MDTHAVKSHGTVIVFKATTLTKKEETRNLILCMLITVGKN